MSDSRKKRPYVPVCGGSQKVAKRWGNRALRRVTRRLVADPNAVLPVMDEVLNRYNMPQDGSRHYLPFHRSPHDYRTWYRYAVAK